MIRQIFLRKSKRPISRLIFHHFGTNPPAGMNAAKIRAMHMLDRGWDDIGYHGVIMPDGEFQIGRDVNNAGAHTFGFNRRSLGFMFVAGLKRGHVFTKPTDRQLNTARLLAEEQKRYYGQLKVEGHGDLTNTQCPGFDVPHWYKTNEVRPMRHR